MFCFPECRDCVALGKCEREIAFAKRHPVSTSANWAPNRLDFILYPCGCTGLPWPIVYNFGESIIEIWCDQHGLQKITKAQRKRWKTLIKEMKFEPMDRLEYDD